MTSAYRLLVLSALVIVNAGGATTSTTTSTATATASATASTSTINNENNNSNNSNSNSKNTDCDVSPNALTEQFGVPVPQSCIMVGNRKRCYYTYIPDCITTSTSTSTSAVHDTTTTATAAIDKDNQEVTAEPAAAAVVYDIHGYGECPRTFSAYSGWFQKATEECFVVVWPMGNIESEVADAPCWSMPGDLVVGEQDDSGINSGKTASCCCQKDGEPSSSLSSPSSITEDTSQDDTSDLDFLHQIAFYLVKDIPTQSSGHVQVDTRRIYMSGHANGCLLAHAMAAHHSDLVAAVACMAGIGITPYPSTYEPVPTWTIGGALDDVIPTGGATLPSGDILYPGQQAGFQLLSDLHACSNTYSNSTPVHDMNLPEYPLAGALHVQTAFGCLGGAIVQHLTLQTAGHLLYQGVPEVFPSNAADTTIDTTAMAWGFLTSFQSGRDPILQQQINLDDIQDLMDEEKEEEQQLVKENTMKEQQEMTEKQDDKSKGNEPSLILPNKHHDEEEEEDEMSSPWQGLRGISEGEALSS